MSKLPHVVLNELKCADCRSYLSYSPIKILPNGAGICGRCTSRIGIYSPTFDKLSGIFVYPCKYRNRGCFRVLSFREVSYHEKDCSYKPGCCFCCRHPCMPCASKPNDRDIEGVKPIIADDRILSTLRCTSCSKYLSSSPIFIAPDGSDICYACSQYVHPELTRNIPLENILNAFVFQCTYIGYGCENLFSFGAISVHESNCEHYFHYQNMMRLETQRNYSMNRQQKPERYQNSSSIQELNAENLRRKHESDEAELRKQKHKEAELRKQKHEEAELRKQKHEEAELRKQKHEEAELRKHKHEEAELRRREQQQVEKRKKSSPRSSSHQASDRGSEINDKPKEKVRGLVETPRGQIYATITPNNAYIHAFKPPKKTADKHNTSEDNSGRSTPSFNEHDTNGLRYSGGKSYNNVVEEFKFRKKLQANPRPVPNY